MSRSIAMSKRAAARTAVLAAALALGGCIGAPVHFDEPPVKGATEASSRPVRGTACGFQLLLLIPINLNSRMERAYAELKEHLGPGEWVADVQIEEEWFYGFVGTGYCSTVHARAVRYAPGTGTAAAAPAPMPVAPVSAAASPMAGAFTAPVSGAARSSGEIGVIVENRKPMFDRAVTAALHGVRTPGTVTVDFTVEPDGTVDHAAVTASSFADPAAAQAVVRVLESLQYQAKPVPAQSVSGYVVHVN